MESKYNTKGIYMHNRNKFTDMKADWWLPKRKGGAYKLGPQDQQIQITLHKTDKQRGFTV